MAGRDPPFFLNTEADRGAIVAVVTINFAIVSTLACGVRIYIRQRKDGALGLDDALIAGASVVAIIQSGLVIASVKHGLGRYFDALSSASKSRYYKFSYASSLLAILAMCLAKFSVLHLQRRLCGNHSKLRYSKVIWPALGTSIAIWTLFGAFALGFQCGVERPEEYQPGRCASGMLWYPVTILNAVTDAALAVSFSPIIWSLNTAKGMKIKLMGLLGSRFLVCTATIVQVAALARALTQSDQTRAMVGAVSTQQVVMNLSIITAVTLGLHGFFANMTTGRFGVEVRTATDEASHRSYDKARTSSGANDGASRTWYRSKYNRRSEARGIGSHLRSGEDGLSEQSLNPGAANTAKAWRNHEEEEDGDDTTSQGSQENIIRQTFTWQVSRDVPDSMHEGHEMVTLPLGRSLGETKARNFVG